VKKGLLLLLLIVSLLTFGDSIKDVPKAKPVPHNVVISTAHATTHKIEFRPVLGSSHCSATAIGPQTLLTASHCECPSDTIIIDLVPHQILASVRDSFDHTLFMVDEKFTSWATLSNDEMQAGDDVFIFGNPSEFVDLFRKGYVSSYPDRLYAGGAEANEIYLDFNGFPGDSGAGIFNASGELVGVVSFGKMEKADVGGWPTFKIMGAYPLQFPAKEVEEFISGKVLQ